MNPVHLNPYPIKIVITPPIEDKVKVSDVEPQPSSIELKVAAVSFPVIEISIIDETSKAILLLKSLEEIYAANKSSTLTSSHFKYLPIHQLIRLMVIETFTEFYADVPQNNTKECLKAFQDFNTFFTTNQSVLRFFQRMQQQYNVPQRVLIILIKRLKLIDELNSLEGMSLKTQKNINSLICDPTNNDYEIIFLSVIKIRTKLIKSMNTLTQIFKEVFGSLDKSMINSSRQIKQNIEPVHKEAKNAVSDFEELTFKWLSFSTLLTNRYPQIQEGCAVKKCTIYKMDSVIRSICSLYKMGIKIYDPFNKIYQARKCNFDPSIKQIKAEGNKFFLDLIVSVIYEFHININTKLIDYLKAHENVKHEIEKLTMIDFTTIMKKITLTMKKYKNDPKMDSKRLKEKIFESIKKDFKALNSQPLIEFVSFTMDHIIADHKVINDKILSDSHGVPSLQINTSLYIYDILIISLDKDKMGGNVCVKTLENFTIEIKKECKKLKTASFELMLDQESDDKVIFGSGNVLNTCLNLDTFISLHTLCNSTLLSTLQYCKGNVSLENYTEVSNDSLWMHSIDAETEVPRPKSSIEKKKITPPKKPATKKSEKSKPISLSKKDKKVIPSVVCTPKPMELYSSYRGFLYENDTICPSSVSSQNTRLGPYLYDLDQGYHLAHLDLTLEMMNTCRDPSMLSLLMPSFNYYLYMIQEQTITPAYLSANPEGELIHNLVYMTRGLNINLKCARHSKGSYWFRYPNQNTNDRYSTAHESTSLDVSLKLEQENTDHTHQLVVFNEIAKEGVKFFTSGHQERCLDPNDKPYFDKIRKDLERRLNAISENAQSITDNQMSENTLQKLSKHIEAIDKLHTWIENERNTKWSSRPKLIPVLNDLLIHIKRLQHSVSLLKAYPQQRYLSVHARNVVFFGQYMIELAGTLECLSQRDDFRDHNLSEYASRLNWNTWLGSSRSLIDTLNVKKGSEYIFWEFYKAKGDVPTGLQLLNDTYHMSITAAESGEGFTPKGLSGDINTYHEAITDILSEEVNFLELYTKNILLKLQF